MKVNEDAVAELVFKSEGGYAERPTEGGGAVNRGITFTVFKAWRALKGQTNVTWEDLKNMSKEEAIEIYKAQFFKGVHFDDLPPGVDYAVYDASVTGGVAGSLKILQKILGFKGDSIDGHFGLATKWAVNHRAVHKLIDDLADERSARYKTFNNYKKVAIPKTGRTWGQIWEERIKKVREQAHKMAEDYYGKRNEGSG